MVVVGGGIAGCVAARVLARDHDVLVVERDLIDADEVGRRDPAVFDH